MPIVLTEVVNYDATITVPVDGDVRNAASVQVPLQSLTNRSAFFNAQIGALGSGVKKVRTASGVAAIKALVGMQDGEIAVTNGGFPYASLGWIYNAAGADPEFVPWVLAPNSGGGRWYNLLQAYVNQAGGASGAAARWTIPVANALVTVAQTSITAPGSYTVTPLGPFVDSGAISNAITLNVGDTVLVEASSTLVNNTTNSNSVSAQLAVLDPAAVTTALTSSRQQLSPGGFGGANLAGAAPINLKYVFTALLAGAHQFKIQVQAANVAGATVSIYQPTNFIVSLVRPLRTTGAAERGRRRRRLDADARHGAERARVELQRRVTERVACRLSQTGAVANGAALR